MGVASNMAVDPEVVIASLDDDIEKTEHVMSALAKKMESDKVIKIYECY